jgi:peptidoglycan hydrolase-like protein with peptidoglycan-binding domain
VNQWFQNSRGLVIVALAIATGVLLLAIEPSDSFPKGAAVSSGTTPLTPSTTVGSGNPPSTTTTTLPASAKPPLQQGSQGPAVTALQQRLNALGYNVGTPDGVFGAGTKAALIAFQKKKGLTADGVVNQATYNALTTNQ